MRAFPQHRVSVSPAIVLVCALLTASVAVAQAPTTPVKHHRKPHAAHAAAQATPPAVVEPPKPDWPVNDRPAPASVTWDDRSLRVDASNSSLDQILGQITTATGAKIIGAAGDQRVFGVFGPGNPRDVLSQLLQGSGYNVVMVGDNGRGLPREVLLSERHAAGNAPIMARAPQPEDDYEEPQPDNSQMDAPPQPLDNQPRTPPQIQEQQRIQEQQMMQQPGQPQPQPPQ